MTSLITTWKNRYCVYKYPFGVQNKFCIVTIDFVDRTKENIIACAVHTNVRG